MRSNSISVLPEERKNEIRASLSLVIPELKRHRAEHKELMSRRKINLREPAWVRVNPGPSPARTRNSYRLCIGFKNIGCKYRESDPSGLGCLMCGYYARTAFKNVGNSKILEQFKSGLIVGHGEATRFNSIEFLNDGSFLNPDEFNEKIRVHLLSLVSRMRYVKRVLVESRPEHVKEHNIKFVLGQLRKKQLLEVGIGLETADDFIRDACINKGLTLKEFEDAVSVIAQLAHEYPNQIAVVAYLLIKPPFLTHRESIEDAVATLKYLHTLSAKLQIHIAAKLEPAAIANGTMLSLLYQKTDPTSQYEPLSYWAVLEILARTACEIGTDAIEVRIGAREDMDEVVRAPAIYNEDGETFHPFDFVIYESIQKFNQHQDLRRTMAVISQVYHRFYGESFDSRDSSLTQWLARNDIERSAIVEFLKLHTKAIEQAARTRTTRYDIEFISMIYAVLDIMEGYNKESKDLKQKIDKALMIGSKKKLGLRIDDCFRRIAPNEVLQSTVIDIKHNSQYGEVFFDVKDLLKVEKVSVWSRFALNNKVG